MESPLETLLTGAIDYAGLFPPAKLEFAPALQEYRRHLEGEEAWLVSHFVCPVALLPELVKLVEPNEAISVSVIGTGGADGSAFNAAAKSDVELIQKVETDHLTIDGYEVRLPAGMKVAEAAKALRGLEDRDAYLEIPLGPGLEDHLHAIADSETLAAKARTGGTTPGSHPSSPLVAAFLRECLDLVIPFKLTAGLHHPLPFDDPVTGDRMHGFLNVFFAAALGAEEDFSRSEIAAILEDRDPRNFTVSENAIAWRGTSVGEDALADLRDLMGGFGSCSVLEPVADLKTLGLW
jgi:hypothetical protein